MNKPLRVLQMIGSLNTGGSQAVVLNLFKAINRDAILFDFIIDKPDEVELAPVVKGLGGRIFIMPTFRGNNILEIRKTWDTFFREHREYRILHSHMRSYASLYFPVARRNGVKCIIHSHSTSNGHGVAALAKRILQYPLRYQADYYLSCSEEAGKWLYGPRIVSSSKYHLLQNAIDLKQYSCDETIRTSIRKQLGINDQFVYIHVGRLHPSKNHDFLLRVFSEIEKTDKQSMLLLVGDGELHDEIANQIKSLGLNEKVIMLGMRRDVPDLLRAADCFLFPSSWEGLPITVIEAQAAGLPCFISANVTNNVFISPLAKKVSIAHGTDEWLKAIEKTDLHRQDVKDYIKKAGFDIQDTAEWISNLYLSMAGELYFSHNYC